MHHTIFLCFALLIPLVFLGGCAPSASDAYHKITPQAGYEMMKKEEITLIDVREPAEYQQGHIPGARLIPLGTIDETIKDKLPDKKKVLKMDGPSAQGFLGLTGPLAPRVAVSPFGR